MTCAKIKICDVRTMEALRICQDNKVDFIGLHQIHPPVTAENIALFQEIVAASGEIQTVLLTKTVPMDEIVKLLKQVPFDYIQLHRPCTIDEIAELKDQTLRTTGREIGVIAVFQAMECNFDKVRQISRHTDFILFDSKYEGGSGETISVELLRQIAENCKGISYFVAGGLGPENVAETIRIANPYGVDVQSKLEVQSAKHVKDPEKVKNFVHNVRSCHF